MSRNFKRFQPDFPSLQRDYDRQEPPDEPEDVDDEDLERRAIVRRVKAGVPVPDGFDN